MKQNIKPNTTELQLQLGQIKAHSELEDEWAPISTPDRPPAAFQLSEPRSDNSIIADWVAAAKLAGANQLETT